MVMEFRHLLLVAVVVRVSERSYLCWISGWGTRLPEGPKRLNERFHRYEKCANRLFIGLIFESQLSAQEGKVVQVFPCKQFLLLLCIHPSYQVPCCCVLLLLNVIFVFD